MGRDSEVLNLTGQVTETQIDELVSLTLDEGQDVGSRLGHDASFQLWS
jgi:hypothetical protein